MCLSSRNLRNYFMFSSLIRFLFFHQHSLFFYFLPLRHHTHSLYSTVFLCPPSQMWEPVTPHRNKMKNNEYESVEHIDSDVTLMFENAKRYNVPHSSIYKRALKLQHIQQVSPSFHCHCYASVLNFICTLLGFLCMFSGEFLPDWCYFSDAL